MADIINLTDRVGVALERLLNQYREKPRMESIVEAIGEQSQEIEDALFGLVAGRALGTAVGAQLDLIGEIVGQARGEFLDDFYRILLNVKIGQNTSQANPQKIIDIYKLLTQAVSVHYINLGFASIQLNANAVIAPEDVDFVKANMERVVAGGVRIDHLVCYDDDSFAFAGTNVLVPGKGFDNDTGTGTNAGKFATLHKETIPFAFAGSDLGARGFGGLGDPLAGGKFQPIGGF